MSGRHRDEDDSTGKHHKVEPEAASENDQLPENRKRPNRWQAAGALLSFVRLAVQVLPWFNFDE